jgi:peptidoglycan/xylan/chitin deacetylase (PgdA/CDA1 family)
MNKQPPKQAYLTMDDAPSASFKKKVDFLTAKSIPAVFFCLGKLLEERFGEAVYALNRGYIIGNHSYDHPYFSDLTFRKRNHF